MKKVFFIVIVFCISFSAFAQNVGDFVQIKTDAKLKTSEEPLSEVIALIKKGETVKIVSYKSGYYFVDFKGLKGYVNDIYFKGNWNEPIKVVTQQKQETSTTIENPDNEMKILYKNNVPYYYFVHNGISVTLAVGVDDIYGKCYTLNFAIENFTGKDFLFYPNDTHIRIIKNGEREVGKIFTYEEFMKKVTRKQGWNNFFVALGESLAASQAGYSSATSSSSTTSGSYTKSSSVGAVAGFYGNNYGAAVGASYGESATVSTSNTVTNTTSYNGADAYRAQQNAQNNVNNYANHQYQIRQTIDDGYLKMNTIRNEERVVGFLVTKYKEANELEIEVTVNLEKYTFKIR